LIMPGESGVSVAQSLAKVRPGLRTIFISGYAENDAVREALQQPNTCYLQKPFRVLMLLEKMREALSDRAAAQLRN
jgi:two-component system, cell cycle sensor histidine kinase and response regulator CckA